MKSGERQRLRLVLLWDDTVLADRVLPRGAAATAGEDPRNTLVLPDGVGFGRRHRLFVPVGAGYHLHPTAGTIGWVRRGGREFALRGDSATPVPLDFESEGMLELGPVQVLFHFVDSSLELPTPTIWQRMDTETLGSLALAFVLQVGLLLGAYLFWDDTPELRDLSVPARPVRVVFQRPPPPDERVETADPADDPGKRAEGREGRFGRPEAPKPSKLARRDGDLVKRVENQALTRALNSNLMGGPLHHVFGGQAAFTHRLSAAMSGPEGEVVMGRGTGGMGIRGLGDGGGGTGFGRVGGMGRFDLGGGTGTRAGLGPKAKRAAPRVGITRPSEVLGFCREADVQGVVRAHQSGIQFCFERELARDPELSGKVLLNWRIGTDGHVMKVLAEHSTLGNPEVVACMIRQVERWQFPPTEGGACQIRYPFVFTNGE